MTDTEKFDKEQQVDKPESSGPIKPKGLVKMASPEELGAKARECISQDNGIVPPEMRAAQRAEANRRSAVSKVYSPLPEDVYSD